MTVSPREALAASLPPTEILARDKEGFPQKSSITFGEVVSSFSRYGSVASKRHGGIYISKSLKIPNCCSTISDNTLKLEPNFRDFGDSLRFSPRSSIRTAPQARSRTPSPCNSSRRPRSLPVTPRSSTAQGQRYREPARRDFQERLKDAYAPLPGSHLDMEGAFRPSLPDSGAATSSFNRGNPGGTASHASAVLPPSHGTSGLAGCTGAGTGGSSGRHALKAKSSPTSLSGNALAHEAIYKRAEQLGDYPSPRSPPGQVAMSAGQPVPRSCPATSCGMPRREDPPRDSWSMEYRGSPKGNPRVQSFVRLNSFLLRTHITSLLSALAEDGWLEAWEKERLCCHARESESPWAQSFLRIYSRFMETEDVPSFVAALKAQAA